MRFLRAEEAAQDFHALFDALKKVFKGKWVMSGCSKGGIATLLQHTFFPNDMDIFVPYVAPFFDTDPELCAQITRCLDDVLSSPVTGITVADEPEVVYRKVIENGKIYILRNNRKYTTTGTEVE